MTPLEKAARALVESRIREPMTDENWGTHVSSYRELVAEWPVYAMSSSLIPDAFRDARAVISSIEPDDAMLEAAIHAWYESNPNIHSTIEQSIRAALTAALRAILAEGEGK